MQKDISPIDGSTRVKKAKKHKLLKTEDLESVRFHNTTTEVCLINEIYHFRMTTIVRRLNIAGL